MLEQATQLCPYDSCVADGGRAARRVDVERRRAWLRRPARRDARSLVRPRVARARTGASGARRLRRGGGSGRPEPEEEPETTPSVTVPVEGATTGPEAALRSVAGRGAHRLVRREQGPRALLPPPDPPPPALAPVRRTGTSTTVRRSVGHDAAAGRRRATCSPGAPGPARSASSGTCCSCSTPTGSWARSSTGCAHRGLYDDSLVIVTADHGVSFESRRPADRYVEASTIDAIGVRAAAHEGAGSDAKGGDRRLQRDGHGPAAHHRRRRSASRSRGRSTGPRSGSTAIADRGTRQADLRHASGTRELTLEEHHRVRRRGGVPHGRRPLRRSAPDPDDPMSALNARSTSGSDDVIGARLDDLGDRATGGSVTIDDLDAAPVTRDADEAPLGVVHGYRRPIRPDDAVVAAGGRRRGGRTGSQLSTDAERRGRTSSPMLLPLGYVGRRQRHPGRAPGRWTARSWSWRSHRLTALTGVEPGREAIRPLGSPPDVRRGRHRCRDHRGALLRRARRRHRGRLRLPRVHPALPAARLGGARRRGDLGRGAGDARRAGRPARRAHRRHRHHRPARDGGRLGPPHRPARCTAPSCGRTGAPRPAATSCASRGLRADRARHHGPRARPVLHRHQGRVAAHRGRRRRRAPTSPSAPIDAWVLWNLTGGPDGGVLATEPSNASRTMLFDIRTLAWSDELLDRFGVPASALPEVRPSSGRFGVTAAGTGVPAGIPVSGIAGDQQAALFGQACLEPGMTKNTYGTGSFVLMHVGDTCPEPVEGLLTTVGWTLADGTTAYALEGAIFVTGAAVQWLRDGLGHHRVGRRDRRAGRHRARHRGVLPRAGLHRARAARGGIRTPAARSSASPAAPAAATWPAPCSSRSASRRATWSHAMSEASGPPDPRAQGRRRRGGQRPAPAAPGRRPPGAGVASRGAGDDRARRRLPRRPGRRGVGVDRPTSPPTGASTPPSSRRRTRRRPRRAARGLAARRRALARVGELT